MLLCCEGESAPIDWLEWVKVGLGFISLAGIGVALVTYLSNTAQKRAEWLRGLFEKFYEEPTYKNVRVHLDQGTLTQALTNGTVSDDEWVIFLNFFELIAKLENMGQLSGEEVDVLFRYNLRKLRDDAGARAYVTQYDFEHLEKRLSRTT